MKKNFVRKEKHAIRLGRYLLGTVALWSILIGLSLAWNLRAEKPGTLETARMEARMAFDKDIVYRRWNASCGGVYAPVTETAQPNPYLDVPERDITTLGGLTLTMINPAFMTRQVHELELKAYGIRGHITSLNPIRPANAPDPWETRALKLFQTGMKEVSSEEEIEGNYYMRLMRPLLTEESCLKCHATQGYKLGDIRGGISVSIPMAPLMAIAQSHIRVLCVWHGLLWLAGLVGIGFGIRRLNQQIHKRIKVEQAQRESEEKYRSMMEAMSDSIYICSPDFRISYMNSPMIKMIGHDATGELCHKALFDKDEQCPWCLHDKVQQGESAELEIVSPKNNRSYHVVHSPIFHEDGSISKMTILRDTTVTKHLEAQLFRSERLSATGQLAAAIAHEINSPLQGIISLLHSIERTHDQDEKLLKNLNLVMNGFLGIRDIVRKLLDLNRPGKEKKQSMNVNSVIEDTVALLKNYLKTNNIKIVLNLSSRIPSITASPQQLGQVFMNLISNAVEAMTGTSKSKAGWKTRETIDGEITVNSDLGKDTITINVADTGPGISEKDLEHIFDPFYTRKKETGTGIGLYLCHGIIEDHKGFITAKNSPEGGAVFTITLPIR